MAASRSATTISSASDTRERRRGRSEGDMIDTVVRLLESRDIPQIQAIYSEPGAYGNTLQLPYQSAEHWEKKLAREGVTSLVAVRVPGRPVR